MEAVARELVRRDIVSEDAGLGPFGHQVPDHAVELMPRSGDLLVAMQEHRQLAAVMAVGLVRDERVRLEHSLESLATVASLVADFSEILEVTADLAFMPGKQDRFDVGEVLVQRRPARRGACSGSTGWWPNS